MITSFRDIKSPADVPGWVAHLATQWPERQELLVHIGQQIQGLPFSAVHVVELGAGPGQLAEFLLRLMPDLAYTGLDNSEPLVAFARTQLASFGDRARLIRTDLNADGWLDLAPDRVEAIVSMQSMHDLGGEAEIDRVYGLARLLLAPGGLFLNADLVLPPGEQRPDKPGRRSIPRHMEMLRAHGYERVASTLRIGDFGCVVGFAPDGYA